MLRILRFLGASSLSACLAVAAACGGSVASDAPADGGVDAHADRKTPPPDIEPEAGDDDGSPGTASGTLVSDEFGGEVQMAASASGRIVVAWIGFDGADIAIRYAISDDHGATFTHAATVGTSVGDPVVGALDDGSFILGGLRADCPSVDTCTNGELFLSRLPAGATALTPMPSLREPTNAFIDHPWMIVHGTDVSLIGAVFPVEDGGTTYDYGMTVWRSPDRGANFVRTELVPANASNEVGVPRFCSGDGNRTWAHFYDGTAPTQGRLRFTDALDDGWSAGNSASAGGTGSGTFGTTGACVAHGDTIYAIIGAPATGGGGPDDTATYDDLHIMMTNNLGATWTEQSVISSVGMQYLLPEINVEPDGTLDVFYYTGASPGSAGRAELVRARTSGTKLDKPIVLNSDVQFISDRASQRWLGDYNALVYEPGKTLIAYGDNSKSSTRIRFASVAQ